MNSSTFTSLLLLAVTAALSPFSLIAFSLVLATGRGPKNGIAFICGWVTTITLIGVVEGLIGSNVEVTESNTAGKWTLALELALGIVLIAVWARRRFRPRPEDDAAEVVVKVKPEPAWQRRIGTMGYVGAFVTGGAVQTWPVMIAAGAAILRLDIGPAAGLAWMFAFALLTTAGIMVLEVLAWRNPSSAVERLDRLRGYIQTHRDSVINWASLVGGLWLTIRGAMGLI
jgi:hypothetical protein